MNETSVTSSGVSIDRRGPEHGTKWGVPVLFVSKHHVRFCELDPFGHMNTNHYLAYFTENRFVGHRDVLDLPIRALNKFSIAPYIRKVELELIRPVLPDTAFWVASFISELSEAYCTVDSSMVNEAGSLHATCKFQIACVNKAAGRAVSWPEDFIRLYYKSEPSL